MSTTTPINGFQIPQLGDAPNIETAIHPFANAIDARVIPIFATVAARNSAITSPTHGMLAYCQDTTELYRYDGSAWIGNGPRLRRCTSTTTLINATFIDIPGLSFPVEANAIYMMWGGLQYISPAVDDIQFRWTLPAGGGGNWRIRGYDTTTVTVTNATGINTSGVAEMETVYSGYITTSSTSGTAKIQAAKVADASTDGFVYDVTWIALQKVA